MAMFPATIDARTNLAPIEKSQFPTFMLNNTPQPRTAGANPCLSRDAIASTDLVAGDIANSSTTIIMGAAAASAFFFIAETTFIRFTSI